MDDNANLPAADEDVTTTAQPHAAGAPMLPVEGHIVTAVRALEAAKQEADSTLLLLQVDARNTAFLVNKLLAIQASADAAIRAYWAYAQLLDCKGQS